ncbi:spermatogenesis- and oogenesis-specific basic helix-loop-helix-containing protein 1 [Molossus molossus]|uniref:spermatogenesis- and oogenesis-specific basic helix-loop-helix-containing protein 1 n=1 Tax=Molossus molossus TaxID=27622 RepID=UPI001745FB20|nr:spermatogenesis- and oogenesis-specific basic helix-loop-helix-containing protein 1 [Molossus molossus]
MLTPMIAFGLQGRPRGSRSLVLLTLPSSSSRPTGAWFACKDPGGGSRPVKTPAVAEGPASGLPRNVLSERERRKRISVSCERLRALLPRFDGRKEDMASVLEMSVQFLRMAGAVVPGGEPQPASCQVLAPCTELWGVWQKDVVQLALTSPTSANAPDPGTAASVTTAFRFGTLDPSPKSLPALEAAPSMASLLMAAKPPAAERRDSELLGSALGCDVEDGPSFPLAASPEWWLGSLEGSGAPAQAPARSSLMDRTELGVLVDPGAGSQELLDGPLEPWGWDVGCPSLAFRDEADSMFPDFSAC